MFKSLFNRKTKVERDLQCEFDEIMKNLIFPFFKELGFKKNGNGFNKNIGEITQVVKVQKNRWNHKDSVSFTFNIGFFIKELYLETWKNEIPKFIHDYDCQIWFRIGRIIERNDYWYELNEKTEKKHLEIELLNHLKVYLKPILEQKTDLKSLKELILDDKKFESHTAAIYKIMILLKVGEIEKATDLLKKEYSSSLNPEDYVSKTVHPNGEEETTTSKSKINYEYLERLKEIAETKNITLAL